MPRNKKNKGGGGAGGQGAAKPNNNQPKPAAETPAVALPAEDSEALKTRLAEAKQRLTQVEAVIETIGTQRESTDTAIQVAAQSLKDLEKPVGSATAEEPLAAVNESNTGTAKKNKKHNKNKVHNLNPPEGSPTGAVAIPVPPPKCPIQQTPASVATEPTKPDAKELPADADPELQNQSSKNKKKNKNKNKQAQPEQPANAKAQLVEVVADAPLIETKTSEIADAEKPKTDQIDEKVNAPLVETKEATPVGDGKKKKNKNKNKNKNEQQAEKSEETSGPDNKPKPIELKPEPISPVAEIKGQEIKPIEPKVEAKPIEPSAILPEATNPTTDTVIPPTKPNKKNKNKNKHNLVIEETLEEHAEPDEPATLVATIKLPSPKDKNPPSKIESSPSISGDSSLAAEITNPLELPQTVPTADAPKTHAAKPPATDAEDTKPKVPEATEATKPQTQDSVKSLTESVENLPLPITTTQSTATPEPVAIKEEEIIQKPPETIWKILDPPTDVAVIEGNIKHKKGHKKEAQIKDEIIPLDAPPAADTKNKDEKPKELKSKKTAPLAKVADKEAAPAKSEAKPTIAVTEQKSPVEDTKPETKEAAKELEKQLLSESLTKLIDTVPKQALVEDEKATTLKLVSPPQQIADTKAKDAIAKTIPAKITEGVKITKEPSELKIAAEIEPQPKTSEFPVEAVLAKKTTDKSGLKTDTDKKELKLDQTETQVAEKKKDAKTEDKPEAKKTPTNSETKKDAKKENLSKSVDKIDVKDTAATQSPAAKSAATKAKPVEKKESLKNTVEAKIETKTTPELITPTVAAPETAKAQPPSDLSSPVPADNKKTEGGKADQQSAKPKTNKSVIAASPITATPTPADPTPKKDDKKETKGKQSKVKSKAPQPPRTEDSPAPSETSVSSASTIVEVASASSPPADETSTVLSDSKNVQRSVSVQSADAAAIKDPKTDSLQANPVSTEKVAAPSNSVPETVAPAKAVSPTTNKRNKNEANTKKSETIGETKAHELPEKTPQEKLDQTQVSEVQLLDILEPKMSTGTKAGAVAGNVRVKPGAAAKNTEAKTSKETGAIPKTTPVKEKKATTTASAAAVSTPKKQGSPKPEAANKTKADAKTVNKDASPKPAAPAKKEVSSKPDSPPKPAATRKAASPPKTSPPKTSPPPATATKAATPNNKSPTLNNKTAAAPTKPAVPPRPNNLVSSPPSKKATSTSASSSNASTPSPNMYDDEEYVEYKFAPRPVFMSTICQTCKIPLQSYVHCKQCMMISYCTVEHLQEDEAGHKPLCAAIQEIAKKRGGHIYNNSRILNDDDYRSLRVHTLNLCENQLKRHLQPYEREILLFPRLCSIGSCREWRQHLLTECKTCGQVSYCAANPDHLGASHTKWCQAFALYQKLVVTQKHYGRIEPSLPSKIMSKQYVLTPTIDETFKNLYKNYGAIKDECTYAALTQLATAPLTAYYGIQLASHPIGERFTIHLIGAELQFEADTLDKWEMFFLHLVPQLVELRVVFVGPELNAENLPLEILSRIRMCRACRQNCRAVKFDFQCGTLYHDYVKSNAFTQPDLVCFFNPGLYRATGFNGQDTWPESIKAATSLAAPILVTSYTEVEAPRDLDRLQKEAGRDLTIITAPHINPFTSQRPERNFISDEVAPMIFKNFYCFVCK